MTDCQPVLEDMLEILSILYSSPTETHNAISQQQSMSRRMSSLANALSFIEGQHFPHILYKQVSYVHETETHGHTLFIPLRPKDSCITV